MQAVILAAGMGKRLKYLTKDNTKCMVKVNGVTLIERMLRQLDKINLDRIIIVVGYEGEKLVKYIESIHVTTSVIFVKNLIYNKTNNIYSLFLAKDYLMEDDTLLLESDLIFENEVLEEILKDPRETLALVDKYESWMDGTCLKLNEHDEIEAFVPKNKFVFEEIAHYYKTVNIYKFSRDFSTKYYVPFLIAYSSALGNNEYYEQVLRVITMLDKPKIEGKKLDGQLWYEIDDIQDLDIASSIFAETREKHYRVMQERQGGYWRYPKVLDYIYLSNPFYPPAKMKDEIKASLDTLISSYPSGHAVESLLAAKNYDVKPEQVMVSNGLGELMKSITSVISGNIGIIGSVNEEYFNNREEQEIVRFYIKKSDFDEEGITDKILDFCSQHDFGALFIGNPDIYWGKCLPLSAIRRILEWTHERRIFLIADESLCDFSGDGKSILNKDFLKSYNKLVILKDLSVSEGVAGLRLGCAITDNMELIARLRMHVPVWNINSVAEFYLQIAEKYGEEYFDSIEKIKKERKRMFEDLSEIAELNVYDTQANFLLVKVEEKYSTEEIAEALLEKYRILVKGEEYLHIPVHNREENDRLTCAVKELMSANGRYANSRIVLDNNKMKDFFEQRANKGLPHRYNYVIYQDSHPELALQRDEYEKSRFLKYMHLKPDSIILDIGCGVGRWGDEIVRHLSTGRYVGVDYSPNMLEVARKELGHTGKCDFFCGDFKEIREILRIHQVKRKFDVILLNGILMYINDDDILKCLEAVNDLLVDGGVIYIKESVGKEERLTLKEFYSNELKSNYSAIYRSINEYNSLLNKKFINKYYKIVSQGETWKREQQNRSDTTSYYWIINKRKMD